MIAPFDSQAVLLAWADARKTSRGAVVTAEDVLRSAVPNVIDALLADPRRMCDAWYRGSSMGRKREQGRAALAFLVAAGTIAPSRMGPPPKDRD